MDIVCALCNTEPETTQLVEEIDIARRMCRKKASLLQIVQHNVIRTLYNIRVQKIKIFLKETVWNWIHLNFLEA